MNTDSRAPGKNNRKGAKNKRTKQRSHDYLPRQHNEATKFRHDLAPVFGVAQGPIDGALMQASHS
ncbi:MAG: hypothetical protein H7X76_01920 [Prolixibacteraceae bacterium]|nr:hypothetical protein [Burkholderiales bacterium]